ncbi:Hypothetical predicted protein [Octopus vulgaris]|uniref:Uncharacterized protein n=1 Tax=Octopus vulgaris TaxID=6645 RepID=A0AA36AI89_OCTVU|nr:Hypothetical predicted protein [Octopus vulgaris]
MEKEEKDEEDEGGGGGGREEEKEEEEKKAMEKEEKKMEKLGELGQYKPSELGEIDAAYSQPDHNAGPVWPIKEREMRNRRKSKSVIHEIIELQEIVEKLL